MLDKIKNEPVRVVNIVLAVIGVLAAFGLGITDGQSAGIVALVSAVLALIGGEASRANVAPMSRVAVLRDRATGKFVTAKAHPKADGAEVHLDEAA